MEAISGGGAVVQKSGLHRIARANEDIKKVIRVSSSVNLVALNAMLIAKRSGEKSRGFAVVSSELRVFSRKLEAAMTGLGVLVSALVRSVAATQKQQHELLHLLRIHAKQHQASEMMEPVLVRMEKRMLTIQEDVAQGWEKLRLQLNRILQLCETGGSLSRSAKIEAVYGGDMSVTLKQVAGQVDEIMSEIFSILKLLRTQLAE